MKYGARRVTAGVFLLMLGAVAAQLEVGGRLGALVMLVGIWLLMWGGEAVATRLREKRAAHLQWGIGVQNHVSHLQQTATSSFEHQWTEWERASSAARLQNATKILTGGARHAERVTQNTSI